MEHVQCVPCIIENSLTLSMETRTLGKSTGSVMPPSPPPTARASCFLSFWICILPFLVACLSVHRPKISRDRGVFKGGRGRGQNSSRSAVSRSAEDYGRNLHFYIQQMFKRYQRLPARRFTNRRFPDLGPSYSHSLFGVAFNAKSPQLSCGNSNAKIALGANDKMRTERLRRSAQNGRGANTSPLVRSRARIYMLAERVNRKGKTKCATRYSESLMSICDSRLYRETA